MRHRRIAASIAFALGAFTACAGEKQLHGVMIDPPRDVAAFQFTLPSGAAFNTAAETGRPMVVFFGYTHCPDVCPTTLADWKRAKQKLGKSADRVRFVFVTVDPERDSAIVADKYAKQFDSAFIGVSGTAATTQGILTAFGASSARESGGDSLRYLVSHSAQAFLVNDKGQLIAMYPFGIGWQALADDLESIL